jgi:hypothetical protein
MRTCLALAIVGFAARAHAQVGICDCAPPQSRSMLAPASGATNVPVNARVWLGMRELGIMFPGQGTKDPDAGTVNLSILGPNGASVDYDESGFGTTNDFVTVLVPKAPLPATSEFTVFVNETAVGTFTTGTTADTTPPAVPTVKNLALHANGDGSGIDCGASNFAQFDLDFGGDTILAIVGVGGSSDIDTKGLRGPAVLATENSVIIGERGCAPSNWDGAAPGAATTIEAGFYDVAGNFSGWSKRQVIVLPDAGCGCGALDGGVVALAGLAAFARKRPRRG